MQIHASRKLVMQAAIPSVSREEPKRITISFQYVSEGQEHCLSACDPGKACDAMKCFRIMTSVDWVELGRCGLQLKDIPDHSLTGVSRPQQLDPAIPIYEVRATQQMRIFGARKSDVFFFLWADPFHRICPE